MIILQQMVTYQPDWAECRLQMPTSSRDKNKVRNLVIRFDPLANGVQRVFRLAEINQKSTDLATQQEELDQILKASVPGLVSKSQRRSTLSSNSNNAVTDGPVAGHKLLIDPNVFNISLLLPPSLSFLQRLKDIVPSDSGIAISTLTSFLDEFLINVFYPQLEETVVELCTQSFMELDAFQKAAQWSQHAARPIFKVAKPSCNQAFCKLLDTIPQDQAHSELIISQIVAYYNRCYDWYRGRNCTFTFGYLY